MRQLAILLLFMIDINLGGLAIWLLMPDGTNFSKCLVASVLAILALRKPEL